MEKTIGDLAEDEENLTKFLEAVDKTKEDFESEADLQNFLLLKIYEKEFSSVRKNAIESLETAMHEAEDIILGDMERDDLKHLQPLLHKSFKAMEALEDGKLNFVEIPRLDLAMSTPTKRVAFHTMGCKLNFSEA